MQKCAGKLTVFFDEPFWVGVYERETDGKLEVCRIVFGAEPKDYEVYDLVLRGWNLLDFSEPIDKGQDKERRINPKRMQRKIKKQLQEKGLGTKAQQALKAQQAAHAKKRKEESRQRHVLREQLKFEQKQEKKKQKHRGH